MSLGFSKVVEEREDTSWQLFAACSGTPAEVFFPRNDQSKDTRVWGRAKSVCLNCPVRAECLEYALDHEEKFGCWGGRSPKERDLILATREKRTVNHGSRKPYCDRGHRFTDENTYNRPDGRRSCKECDRLRARERWVE